MNTELHYKNLFFSPEFFEDEKIEPELDYSLIQIAQGYEYFYTFEEYKAANVYPLPDSISISINSPAGGGAVPTRIYLLNQSYLLNEINNGSGTDITYIFSDGFTGRVLSSLIDQARAGVGAICFGVAIRLIETATGNADATGLENCAPFFQYNDCQNNFFSKPLNVEGSYSRKDKDLSIVVIPCKSNINSVCQFSFIIPPGDDATVTFYFTNCYSK